LYIYTREGIEMTKISSFVKYNRKKLKLTQAELAKRAGVGLRFVRELERGKETLRVDKVNLVLALFGFVLTPEKDGIDPYEIALRFLGNNSKFIDYPVIITLKNRIVKRGFIVKEILSQNDNKITAWEFLSHKNVLKYKRTSSERLTEIISHSEIENIESE